MDGEVKTDHDVYIGPYRATRLWNDVVQALQAGLPCGRHRRYMRTYDDCFAAHEAVDWTLAYLRTNPNFGLAVTRAQTVQLLNKLMKAGVFEGIGRQKQHHNNEFGDNGRLYRFSRRGGGRPGRSALAIRSVTNLQTAAISSPHRPPEQLPECHLKAKVLSAEEISDVWKHCLLHRLQTVLGVGGLEEILDASLVSGRNILHNCLYITKTGVVTNIEEKDHLPHWALSAMKCLAKWPEKTDDNFPSYEGFEKDVFRVVADYFTSLPEPLMTWDMYEVITNIYVQSTSPHPGLKRSSSTRKSVSSPLWSLASLENIFHQLGLSSSPHPYEDPVMAAESGMVRTASIARLSRTDSCRLRSETGIAKPCQTDSYRSRSDARLNKSFSESPSSSRNAYSGGRRSKAFGSQIQKSQRETAKQTNEDCEKHMRRQVESTSHLTSSRPNSKVPRRGTPKLRRASSLRRSASFSPKTHQRATNRARSSSDLQCFRDRAAVCTEHVHVVSPHCEVVEMGYPPAAAVDGACGGQGFVVCVERRGQVYRENTDGHLGPGDLYPIRRSLRKQWPKRELQRNFFDDEVLVENACHNSQQLLSMPPRHHQCTLACCKNPTSAQHGNVDVVSPILPLPADVPTPLPSPPQLRKCFSSGSSLHLSSLDPLAESTGLQSASKFGSTPSFPVARYETAFGPDNKTVTRVYYAEGVATDFGHVSAGDREVCTPLETHFDAIDSWQGTERSRGDPLSRQWRKDGPSRRSWVTTTRGNRLYSEEVELVDTPVSSWQPAEECAFLREPVSSSHEDLCGGPSVARTGRLYPHVPVLDGSSRSQLSKRLSLSSPNLIEASDSTPSSNVCLDDARIGDVPSLSCQKLEEVGMEKYRDIGVARDWFGSSHSASKRRPKSMACAEGDSLWFSGITSRGGRSYNAHLKASGGLSAKRKSCQDLGPGKSTEMFTPIDRQHRSRSLAAFLSSEMRVRDEEKTRQALQMACLLLPAPNRRKLQLLFRLMSRMVANSLLCLDPAQTTHSLLLNTFSRSILCAEDETDMDDLLVNQLVSFLMTHHTEIFAVPADLKKQVEERLKEMQKPQISYSPVSPTSLHFCQQVSVTEFENQRADLSESAMRQLLEHIITDTKLSQKEKKKRLKQFQKTYPKIYAERFPDSGSSKKQKEASSSKPRIKQPLLARPLMRLKGLRL